MDQIGERHLHAPPAAAHLFQAAAVVMLPTGSSGTAGVRADGFMEGFRDWASGRVVVIGHGEPRLSADRPQRSHYI